MKMKAGKGFKQKSAGKPKSMSDKAAEPVKMAKKLANPTQATPMGGSQMKFDPAKKPKQFGTDRGIFGMK